MEPAADDDLIQSGWRETEFLRHGRAGIADDIIRPAFLSTLPASRQQRRLALAVISISLVTFLVCIPFARVQLSPIWAFIPIYESALFVNDLITASLLFVQFSILRSRGLLALACAYLFAAIMVIPHALTFPGLFSSEGLLGAGPQSTAWLYMFWHGGFPTLVILYAALTDKNRTPQRSVRTAIFASIGAVCCVAVALTLIATSGQTLLPTIMSGNGYTSAMTIVISVVAMLIILAVGVLLRRRPFAVLDLWLVVVMCAWLCDVALSVIFNAGRFDIGFYAGRIYGLLASTFVLLVLLFETEKLYAQLVQLFQAKQLDHRRQMWESLRDSEQMARGIITTALDAFVQLNESGNILEWSPKAEAVFGWTQKEAIGRKLGELIVPPANRDAHVQHIAHFLEECEKGTPGMRFEAPSLRRDGEQIDTEVSLTALRRPEGYIINGFIRDITEKRAAEEELRQAQKMESIGQLTGGVAHDFNNMLTVITGTIDILADAVADKPQLAAITKLISEAADRGAELTGHLLAFARKQPLQPREIDINSLMLETQKLLRPTLGQHVEIEVSLAPDAWPALVDPTQLTTALVNLAVNARDAMSDGGKLTLETRNVALDQAYADVNGDVQPGSYVLVAVSDTGAGIPEAIRKKIFEPFFTTKGLGKGTGLGLSMVYGFVKQSGGHIQVYSEEGCGTTFKIYLPRAGAQAGQVEASMNYEIEGGTETILVAEDDPLVLASVTAQLESLGYQTVSAVSAAEALALVDKGVKFDLLFTDVIMPGSMNGRQLSDAIAKRRHGLKVLFTSGYTESAVIHHGRLDPGVLLLTKPYRKQDLARMLRRAFAGKQSSPQSVVRLKSQVG